MMCISYYTYIDVETRIASIQRLIKRLIECDDIVQQDKSNVYIDHINEVFIGISSSLINSDNFLNSTDLIRSQKEIYLFLKRVCLSVYFLFKPLVFSKMPKEFLHFALKPYNCNVDYTKSIHDVQHYWGNS